MEKTSISILVPVYNVEKFLPRCIESVLSQNLIDYELILVDDGSTDNSGNICDEYASKYPKFIKVIHKKNGGLPSARLAGFQHASGKYIMFLDSDDYLLPNALTVLHNKIEEGYDIVKGINKRVYVDGSYTIERHKIFNEEVIGNENYLSKVINADIAPYLWGSLYRKDLIQEEDFKPILSFSVGEDWLLNIIIAKRVNKMVCIDKKVCCYFINNNSIMQSKVCSYEYSERMKNLLNDITAHCSPKIRNLITINRTINNIKCFFIPELYFNSRIYKEIIEVLKVPLYKEYIKTHIERKYLLFINYQGAYFLYTRLYCFLYKSLRLKGITRKIL